MTRCKSCGEEIIWIETPTGKYIPCDVGIIPYWNDSKGKERIVLQSGEVVRCSTEPRTDIRAAGSGRIPHWATCPNASKHRRRK